MRAVKTPSASTTTLRSDSERTSPVVRVKASARAVFPCSVGMQVAEEVDADGVLVYTQRHRQQMQVGEVFAVFAEMKSSTKYWEKEWSPQASGLCEHLCL